MTQPSKVNTRKEILKRAYVIFILVGSFCAFLIYSMIKLQNGFDKEYIEKYAIGFNELKEHVSQFTPEWAYGITTIKPDVIRKTAREMYNAAPSVIVHPGRHVTWYGDDTQRLRSVAILNGKESHKELELLADDIFFYFDHLKLFV